MAKTCNRMKNPQYKNTVLNINIKNQRWTEGVTTEP